MIFQKLECEKCSTIIMIPTEKPCIRCKACGHYRFWFAGKWNSDPNKREVSEA